MSTPALREMGDSPSFPSLEKKTCLVSISSVPMTTVLGHSRACTYSQPISQALRRSKYTVLSASHIRKVHKQWQQGEGSLSEGAGVHSAPRGGHDSRRNRLRARTCSVPYELPLPTGSYHWKSARLLYSPAPSSDLSLVKVTGALSAWGSASEVWCREQTSTLRSQA